MRVIVSMSAIALLSACGVSSVGEERVANPASPASGRGERMVAECKVLELGHARLRAAGRVAPTDLLTGCPGHETARDQMPLKAQTAALRQANAALLPASVTSVTAARAYRRMISRGMPEDVVRSLAEEGHFALL